MERSDARIAQGIATLSLTLIGFHRRRRSNPTAAAIITGADAGCYPAATHAGDVHRIRHRDIGAPDQPKPTASIDAASNIPKRRPAPSASPTSAIVAATPTRSIVHAPPRPRAPPLEGRTDR